MTIVQIIHWVIRTHNSLVRRDITVEGRSGTKNNNANIKKKPVIAPSSIGDPRHEALIPKYYILIYYEFFRSNCVHILLFCKGHQQDCVVRSLVFCVVFCLSSFDFYQYVVCPSSNYGFGLPLWYHQTFLERWRRARTSSQKAFVFRTCSINTHL